MCKGKKKPKTKQKQKQNKTKQNKKTKTKQKQKKRKIRYECVLGNKFKFKLRDQSFLRTLLVSNVYRATWELSTLSSAAGGHDLLCRESASIHP